MNTFNFPTELPERLLRAHEVAKILNVSRAWAYRLMQLGEIRTVMIRKTVRVRPQDLADYIKSCLTPPPPNS